MQTFHGSLMKFQMIQFYCLSNVISYAFDQTYIPVQT